MIRLLAFVDGLLGLYVMILLVTVIVSWLVAFDVINVRNNVVRSVVYALSALTDLGVAPAALEALKSKDKLVNKGPGAPKRASPSLALAGSHERRERNRSTALVRRFYPNLRHSRAQGRRHPDSESRVE